MAATTVKTERVITLTLTEAEAKFIKELCQNALTETEDPEDSKIREALWDALECIV